MAKERIKYRSIGVRGFTAGDLQLSYADVQAKASMFDNINKKIDSIQQFALEQYAQDKAQEGIVYGAENAPNVEEFLKANAEDRESLLPGNKSTTFGKSARNTALSILSNQVLISSSQQFAKAEMEATKNNTSPEEYLTQLNEIIEGSTEALMDVSPEAAIKLNAQLSTKANTYYLSYSDRMIKEWNLRDQAASVGFITQSIEDVSKLIKGPNTYKDQNGEDQDLTIDMKFNIGRLNLETFLLEKNFKSDKVKTYLDLYDKAVLAAKSDFILGMTNMESFNNKEILFYHEVENGTFFGASKEVTNEMDVETNNELLIAKEIWDNASETERTKILGDLNAKISQLDGIRKIENDIVQSKSDEILLRSEVGIIKALKAGNLVEAGNFLAIIETLDASKFLTYSEMMGFDKDKIGSTTPGLVAFLEKEIFYRRISADKIFSYVGGQETIDFNNDGVMDVLSLTDAVTLSEKWATSQEADVQDAIKIAAAKILKSREPEMVAASNAYNDRLDLQLYNNVVAQLISNKLQNKDFNALTEVNRLIDETKSNALQQDLNSAFSSMEKYSEYLTERTVRINDADVTLPNFSPDLPVSDLRKWYKFIKAQEQFATIKKKQIALPSITDYAAIELLIKEIIDIKGQIDGSK